MGRKATTGGVSPLGDNRIQLYFRYQGQKCRPTLDMKPTPPNQAYARRLVADIEERIRNDRFDLAKEFPAYKGLERFGIAKVAAKTFREYGELWLGTKGKLSPSTLHGYKAVLAAHWYQWFGDRLISAVPHSEIAGKMGTLPGSRKTHNNVLDPGRQVFELAKSDKAIAANPCDGIDFLELPEPEPDPYSLAEVESILEKMQTRWGDEMRDYYEYAFFSGMRASEQIEMRWDRDVDMADKSVRVQKARVQNKVKDTKTYYNRTLELQSRAYAALKRQYARTGLAGEYVWLSPFSGNGRKVGGPWLDEHRQGEMFRSVIKLIQIRPRPAKNTRHTYATIMLMSGVKPAWAAAQLGHSVSMFERRYSKWIPRADDGTELAKVEAFAGTKSTGQFTGQKSG